VQVYAILGLGTAVAGFSCWYHFAEGKASVRRGHTSLAPNSLFTLV